LYVMLHGGAPCDDANENGTDSEEAMPRWRDSGKYS
jgi:hypothetical protein